MRGRIFLKTGLCFAAIAMLLVSMMELSLAGGLFEDSPLGDALDKLQELGEKVVDVLTPSGPSGTGVDASSSGGVTAGAPVPDLGGALDPAAVPGLDTLTGALDPSSVPGLDALSGALDPSSLPSLESFPGLGSLGSGGLPSLPGAGGLPEMTGLPGDPMQVLQIIDGQEQIFVVLDLEKLLEARIGLGKDLEKAPLLELQVILFDALAAEGSLGIRKIDDNAFLIPIEVYLKYMSGEEGWKEILDLVLPLELSFPGAGMVPDGLQKLIDALYNYILKPILSLLPIYHEVEPGPVPGPVGPAEPSVVPPVEVKGEVVQSGAGGSGDHLPFTGAELTVLLVLIVSLAVGGLLLSSLERKVKRKAG